MLTAVLMAMCACLAVAQGGVVDPGPRGGAPGAGGFVANLTPDELAFAVDGQNRFLNVDTVPSGLGPFFNLNSCSGCHAQPSSGGSSPKVNPEFAAATLDGADNQIPEFLSINGPVREARFVKNPNGTVDGGVHDLFSITGRSDAQGCQLAQPNFNAQYAAGNVIFRIPTPLFGTGLIENILDTTILNNQAANPLAKALLGIAGVPNRSANTGTITKFGWKAQNPSLLVFAGEAYNVEMGVSNEGFTVERPQPGGTLPASCILNPTPEDTTNAPAQGAPVNSDVTAFAFFMRLLDQPKPAPPTPQTIQGQQVFNAIGCALCHTPSMTTAQSSFAPAALSGVQANLFSDLLVHNMGSGLADGVSQGSANGNQFRTAPLWGVGQRIFELHDGRCGPTNGGLVCAIEAHASPGSEANGVINLFNHLPPSQQQALVNFLRSL